MGVEYWLEICELGKLLPLLGRISQQLLCALTYVMNTFAEKGGRT